MRNFPGGMKTCGIPSTGEVRWLGGVEVDVSVGWAGRVAVGRIASNVAEGSTLAIVAGGTAVEVGSAVGTFDPVQAARIKMRRMVRMSFFMY